MTKLEKFKVDNIQHELIARDETIKSLRQKLSEANKLPVTMKSRPQQMEQEWKCQDCHLMFNSANTLTIHVQNKHQALSSDNLFKKN